MNELGWRAMSLWARLSWKVHSVPPQTVFVRDVFRDSDLILDLGGGGEGIIGRLRGRQVVAVDVRKSELDDAPAGPIKVVADARRLPFPDRSFEAAAAFFSWMYLSAVDRPAVFAEAFRVLVPGGSFHIWDVSVPALSAHAPKLFVVPVRVRLPGQTIRTGYGVPSRGREMSIESVTTAAHAAGFSLREYERVGRSFYLHLTRPAP